MTGQLQPLAPIHVADRFAPLHAELLTLLRGLDAAEWERPTVADPWRVRDVAAHLLDVELRRISVHRDGHRLQPDRSVDRYRDLVGWLNTVNAQWVEAAHRLSPALLVELLAWSGPRVAALMEGADPEAAAMFPVAWAGESVSRNWMDVAREYTEKWHHQQQIRDAVNAPPLTARVWLHPVLDASVRALPHAYRDLDAPDDTAVVLRIRGDAGDDWSLVRRGQEWTLLNGAAPRAAAVVELDANDAWRLLYNALAPDAARDRLRVTGDERLAEPLVRTRSVMV